MQKHKIIIQNITIGVRTVKKIYLKYIFVRITLKIKGINSKTFLTGRCKNII